MKLKYKILLGVTASAALGIYFIKRYNQHRKLSHMADEGYETAHDILYPGQSKVSSKLHYGPVLPQ